MDSGLINKIEKARRYAEDPGRVTLIQFTALFHGDHHDHTLTYDHGAWRCDCVFFAGHDTCSHTMAASAQLNDLIPAEFATG